MIVLMWYIIIDYSYTIYREYYMSDVIALRVKVPQSLDAIKLSDYQKYLKIMDGIEDMETPEAIEFLNLKSLEIFCDLTLKDSYGLPVSMFESVLAQVSNCFNEDTPLVQRFTMTGIDNVSAEFGFIPKLDDISFGEYVDVEKYIGDWQNMHKALAVLYRPIVAGKKGFYIIEEYEGSDKYAEMMKDAPVSVALGAVVFFYRLGRKLSNYMIHYLQSQVEDQVQLDQQNNDSQRSGDGIKVFMDLHKEMSEGFQKLPNFHDNNA